MHTFLWYPGPPTYQGFKSSNNKKSNDSSSSNNINSIIIIIVTITVRINMIVVVQWLSHVWLVATPWTAALQASLSFTISWSLLKLLSIELVMPSNHLILCHPLFLLPSIFLSIRVFSSESDLYIRWPKYWSISFSISPSNEYSELISFKIDWLDLFAVQGHVTPLLTVFQGTPLSVTGLCNIILCSDVNLCSPVRLPLDTCGYWVLEMWLTERRRWIFNYV